MEKAGLTGPFWFNITEVVSPIGIIKQADFRPVRHPFAMRLLETDRDLRGTVIETHFTNRRGREVGMLSKA